MRDTISLARSTEYLAAKHHLLTDSKSTDPVQITRDIVALHATSATSPYLSLLARMPHFDRDTLDKALYEDRSLCRVLCMRSTVHIVESDHAGKFIRGFGHLAEKRTPPRYRRGGLLVQAGLCASDQAERCYVELAARILRTLANRGPATTQELSEAVPELKTRIRHDVGKKYEGEFSIGSRIVNALAAAGVIMRTRPRGSWRSSLYEYASLGDWLPDVKPESESVDQSHKWTVERYLAAFGPASLDDIQWWTGLTKRQTARALDGLRPHVLQVTVSGHDHDLLMLEQDHSSLREFLPPQDPAVFLLPSLDPFVMGYRNRDRFLSPAHRDRVFDRAGNALPTVWVGGRIVGAWGQRRDGAVVTGFFEQVDDEQLYAVAQETQRIQAFVGDEFIKPAFFHSRFTRALEAQ